MELMLTGIHMNAQRAYQVGMVNAVVAVQDRVRVANEYAHKLAASAPLVIELLETFTRESVLPRGPSELQAIARGKLLKVSRSEDAREGGRAFAEKRKPRFRGR